MTRRCFTFGPFMFDCERGALTRDGQPVMIGHRGASLLNALLAAGGRVVAKTDLMEAAWPGISVEESNLSVQIAGLRKLLGSSSAGTSWIATVPRVGYRFVHPASGAGTAHPSIPREPADKPIIAVLPLANLSPDEGDDYLADGISEDIISALTRYRWFQVISRNASFAYRGRFPDPRLVFERFGARYVLEGSLRRSEGRIRLSVQLADAGAGTELWTGRYDVALAEAFAIQDEIAERVAGAIEPELLRSEGRVAVARHTGNMTSWDMVRQGTWFFHMVERATHHKARDLFRGACSIDPELPEANIWRARASAGIIAYGWSDDVAADAAEGLEAGLTAVRLDDRDPYAHYALAIISNYAERIEQAQRAADRAIQLNPSFALGHLVLGMARLFAGQAEAAVGPLKHGLLLSPHDPQNFVWLNLLAHAELFSGRAEDALRSSLDGLKIRPDWQPSFETAACCHVSLAQLEQAQNVLKVVTAAAPRVSDALRPLWVLIPEWRECKAALLRQARYGAQNKGPVDAPDGAS